MTEPESPPARPAPTPRRAPWPVTVLLLLLLPAIVVGIWQAAALHRVDDRPLPQVRRPVGGYRGGRAAAPEPARQTGAATGIVGHRPAP